MDLQTFIDRFIAAFEEHHAELANGSAGKLIALRVKAQDDAIAYYDSIVDAGVEVTEEELRTVIGLAFE